MTFWLTMGRASAGLFPPCAANAAWRGFAGGSEWNVRDKAPCGGPVLKCAQTPDGSGLFSIQVDSENEVFRNPNLQS